MQTGPPTDRGAAAYCGPAATAKAKPQNTFHLIGPLAPPARADIEKVARLANEAQKAFAKITEVRDQVREIHGEIADILETLNRDTETLEIDLSDMRTGIDELPELL